MPQISLYIDQNLYMMLKTKSAETDQSMSRITNIALEKHLRDSWPKGFLDEFFGIFEGESMEEPEEIPWELDSRREEI